MSDINFSDTPNKSIIKYRKTVDVIAIGLLLQMTLSQVAPVLQSALCKVAVFLGFNEGSVSYNNFSSIIGIILYALIFLLPAIFISSYVPSKSYVISCKAKLPKNFVSVIFMTLGCIAVSGSITIIIKVSLESIGIGLRGYSFAMPDDILGLILLFVSSSVVPAVVEEILFRKTILGNLLPYGKWFAIIVSALCFSLMHSNPSQFLYTFIGGILLAIVALKCSSVFPTIIIHFLNNSLSIIYMIIEKYTSENMYYIIVMSIDMILQLCGIIFLCVLFGKGFFELEEENYVLSVSPTKNLVRIFFILYVLYSLFLSLGWVYII